MPAAVAFSTCVVGLLVPVAVVSHQHSFCERHLYSRHRAISASGCVRRRHGWRTRATYLGAVRAFWHRTAWKCWCCICFPVSRLQSFEVPFRSSRRSYPTFLALIGQPLPPLRRGLSPCGFCASQINSSSSKYCCYSSCSSRGVNRSSSNCSFSNCRS